MATGRTQKQVTEVLDTLQDSYDSFSIHQSSVSVDRETYERVAQRSEHGAIEVDVKVHNEEGVLVCETDGAERTPHGLIEVGDAPIEVAARRLVRERTGVSCHVVDLVSANIVAVHETTVADRKPVYRLSVLFEAMYETGEPGECASWHTASAAVAAHPLLE